MNVKKARPVPPSVADLDLELAALHTRIALWQTDLKAVEQQVAERLLEDRPTTDLEQRILSLTTKIKLSTESRRILAEQRSEAHCREQLLAYRHAWAETVKQRRVLAQIKAKIDALQKELSESAQKYQQAITVERMLYDRAARLESQMRDSGVAGDLLNAAALEGKALAEQSPAA